MTGGPLPLGEVRQAMAAALASDDGPDVLASYEDAVEPPVLMLQWAEPWLEPTVRPGGPRTFGPCYWLARINVRCVSGRVDPAPGIAALERLVVYTVERLRADPAYTWPPGLVSSPGIVVYGDIRYQSCTVTYELTVTTSPNGGTDG